MNPTNVDCVVGDTNISNYLSDKYKKLYNSVSYNVNNMQDLVSNIDKLIVQKFHYVLRYVKRKEFLQIS